MADVPLPADGCGGVGVRGAGSADFENYSVLKPGAHQPPQLNMLFDEVVAWSTALAGAKAA